MLLNRAYEAEGRRFGEPEFGDGSDAFWVDFREHSDRRDVNCHERLIMIHRAALANRIREKDVGLNDLFLLCFAIMIVHKLPDYFLVEWFVSNFVPNNAMMPGFACVRANLEAPVIHSRRFSIELLEERAE
jgi:hypothetical protein